MTRHHSDTLAEHARLAERARAAGARLRAVLDATDAAFCIVDMVFDASGMGVDAVFVETSSAFNRLTGLRDAIGTRMSELIPQQPAARLAQYRRVALSGERARLDATLVRGRWIEAAAARLGAPDSRRLCIVLTDVTDKVLAEQELRTSRDQIEATLHAAEVGTWSWEVAEDRVSVDRTMRRLFSVSDAEAEVGKLASYLAMIVPEDRKRVRAQIEGSISARTPYHCEYRVALASGEQRHVIARGQAEYDAGGNAVRLSGVLVDVTRERQLEAAQSQRGQR